MQIHKTVFISYRRTSTPIARNVYDKLTAKGFDVFFDLKSITNGDFEQTILTQIANRAHFVLILTPSTLERCVSPDDWVRREIEEAMKLKRNIVPLFFEGFDYANEKNHLKGDYLEVLPNYNGLRVPWDYFDEAMVRVERDFLNEPLETVLHPVSKQKQVEVAEIKEEIEEEQVTPEQLKAQEYFEKGIAKNNKSDYQGAIDEFTRAILFDENFAEAYFKRGESYWNKNDKEQALVDFEKAVAIDPEHPKINIMQTYILCERQQYNEALVEAEKGIIVNPELDEAYFGRAWVKGKLNDYKQSILDYTKVIELNSDYVDAYNNRGFSYYKLDNYKKAIIDYTKAIELNPQNEEVYVNRGMSYHKLANYEQAIMEYTKAIELNPDYLIAYIVRGNTYIHLKKYEKAINNYKRALEIDPNNTVVKTNLAKAEKANNKGIWGLFS